MKTLLEDYKRRLETVTKLIILGNNSEPNNLLQVKASCYRTFIAELEREIRKQPEVSEEEIVEEIEAHGSVVTYIVGETRIEEVCITPDKYMDLAKAIMKLINRNECKTCHCKISDENRGDIYKDQCSGCEEKDYQIGNCR